MFFAYVNKIFFFQCGILFSILKTVCKSMLKINNNNKLFKVINYFLIKNKIIVLQSVKMQIHIFTCECCVGAHCKWIDLNMS